MQTTRIGIFAIQGVRCMCSTGFTSHLELDEPFHANKNLRRKLKVAILGEPNVGKSTLINKIVGHPVLCVSKKAHTTRERERAAVARGNTQIVFVDTPGLVSKPKLKKHKLDPNFQEDGLRAVNEANIIGVIHDVSNPYTRSRIDPNVMHILSQSIRKRAFLVLNKVDAITNKQKLLGLIKRLTTPAPDNMDGNSERLAWDPSSSESQEINRETPHHHKMPHYWANFTEVFLVSALKGDGVNDVLDYLLKEAHEGSWLLPEGQIAEKPWHLVLKEMVRGRLLDHLPYEVPYNIKIETEYFHENELGEIISVVLVTCPQDRYRRMLLANGGRTVKKVATMAEEDARAALRTNVRLRVVVTAKDKKKDI